jgi:hypothetical protein
MTVLERLKMELSNQQYLTDEQYVQLLEENDLTSTLTYDKSTMCKALWLTCIDVLETVANDVDIMTGISTEFSDIGQAYASIEQRIVNLKDKIASIPAENEETSPFALMYTRGGSKTYGGVISGIDTSVINGLS